MAIKVENNINLNLKLKKITENLAITLKEELIDAAAEISLRTQGGKGIDGSSFKPYAESTRRAKLRAEKQTSPVNLTETGKMLASAVKVQITSTTNAIIGTLGFTSGEEAKKGSYNQEKRPWFGLSDKQKTRILNRLKGK